MHKRLIVNRLSSVVNCNPATFLPLRLIIQMFGDMRGLIIKMTCNLIVTDDLAD